MWLHALLKLYILAANALISGALGFLLTTAFLVAFGLDKTQQPVRLYILLGIGLGVIAGWQIPEQHLLMATIAETVAFIGLILLKVSK